MFFKSLLLFSVIGITSFVDSKRYDVESEAQRLYGYNLAEVLARFRKSTDYIKILTEKATDLLHELSDLQAQILAFSETKMKRQIKEMFGVSVTDKPTSPVRFKSHIKKINRRQEKQDEDQHTQKKIDRIEDYQLLKNYLTAKERNEFKDLGFRYMRDTIQLFIEKTSADGAVEELGSSLMKREHLKGFGGAKIRRPDTTISLETMEDKTRRRSYKLKALK